MERLELLWRELLALDVGARVDSSRAVHIEIDSEQRMHGLPSEARLAWRSEKLELWAAGNTFYLNRSDSLLNVDLLAGSATGVLHPSFWSSPLTQQRELFILAFLILLRSRGVYGLHCCGVSSGDSGVLIVGPSGSGKTTLALSLIREGWRYVADDGVMLRAAETRVDALAFRRGFSLARDSAKHFPEVRAAVRRGTILTDGKRLIDWRFLYPDRQTPTCTPVLLLFPRVADRRDSRFRRLNETESITRLIEQSPGILTDRAGTVSQMQVLEHLVSQGASYDVLLGRDVFEAPGDVSRRIYQLRLQRRWLESSSS